MPSFFRKKNFDVSATGTCILAFNICDYVNTISSFRERERERERERLVVEDKNVEHEFLGSIKTWMGLQRRRDIFFNFFQVQYN